VTIGKIFQQSKSFSRERSAVTGSASDQDLGMATRAAWLSYIGGYTQGQIAERLGVSPVKVHRLIALAHQHNIVKVFIEGAPTECLALEDELKRHFGLSTCLVAPETGGDADPQSFASLGMVGARFLMRRLDEGAGGVIGIGHGRTLDALANAMPRLNRTDVQFVSLIGGLTRRSSAYSYDVVHRLVDRTGGEGYIMPVPFVADSIADVAVLMGQKIVRDVIGLAQRCHLALVGVGALEPDAHMRQTGMLTTEEYEDLRGAGAVGDLLGRFLDIEGQPVPSEVNHRTLGVSMEDLKGREVIAVAGGAGKAKAILATLRSGVLNGLITDEPAARRIVALAREEKIPERRAPVLLNR